MTIVTEVTSSFAKRLPVAEPQREDISLADRFAAGKLKVAAPFPCGGDRLRQNRAED